MRAGAIDAFRRACAVFGGQKPLARRIGTTQSRVWYWLEKSKSGVAAQFVLPIEAATGVRRHELRPDIYPAPARPPSDLNSSFSAHSLEAAMEWTDERIALLVRLRDDGVSYASIAANLGITRGAVSGKIDRLGLAMREPVPRGPRPPRAVLKTRPGVERPDFGSQSAAGAQTPKDAGAEAGALCFAAPEPLIPVASKDDGSGAAPDPLARALRSCSLVELTEDTCRWPVGDVGEPGFFFCGQPPLKDRPYCGPHCRAAFRPLDAKPVSEFVPDQDAARVFQPDTRFGQFAHWDVT